MLKLRNHLTGESEVDHLHTKAKENKNRKCSENVCLGSTFGNGGRRNRVDSRCRPANEVKEQSREFLQEYYTDNPKEFEKRFEQVTAEINENGVYELTEAELNFGVKLAWRNVPRCIGRIQWKNITVIDERKISTAKEMFDAICRHIVHTTNGGNIRSTITVFPNRRPGSPDFRIWNHFIVGYAGYRNPDGTILGHSLNTELTEICLKLGWKCPNPKTKHDILPLVLSANGNDPELFEIPPEIVLEVELEHPQFPWFKDLNIRWYTLPLLSAMLFDCGGVQFPAAPFNGWFTSPEIASRDLGDTNRYNYLEEVAIRMGINTQNSTTLWKDKAMIELNVAVLYSFQKAGVTIIDHHTAAEQFMIHLETERRERGGCPADWAWIVPPISGSTVPVFHQEMALYFLKPSYEYQGAAWEEHVWKNRIADKRRTLRGVALAVSFSSLLFFKRLKRRTLATIVYATETGKSLNFSKRLERIFKNSFRVQVSRMDEYDVSNVHTNSLLIVITSTFGNGDPPANGEAFYKYLSEQKWKQKGAELDNEHRFNDLRFAVFALGSSAYPNVCAFGRNLDYTLHVLGGQRLIGPPCGDELLGQEATFRKWSLEVYKVACLTYGLHHETIAVETPKVVEFRFKPEVPGARPGSSLLENYEQLFARKIATYDLVKREQLHSPLNDAQTMKIVLKASETQTPLEYSVGDHIGIVPKNQKHLVNRLLDKLKNKPTEDHPVEIECRSQRSQEWKSEERLPKCSIQDLLENVLYFTAPATQEILAYLASTAKNSDEKDQLQELATNIDKYDSWKRHHHPHLLTVLEMYESCAPDAATLINLLPILQPRYYSVSSSSKRYANEFHLTVGIVQYSTGGGHVNHGVCSNYLNNMDLGAAVHCFVRNPLSSTFRLPADTGRPLILIAAGTGIAPFRGFWQERNFLKQNSGLEKITLFFGCRSREMTLYKSEIEEMQKNQVITNYYVAFSREKDQQKTYVQHLVQEHGDEMARQILKENAIIYICGDAAMAEEVFQTLQGLIQKSLKRSDQAAADFMRELKESDRCHMDIFGQAHKRKK